MRERDARGILGWDIGGAHVKLARCSASGRLLGARQYPCPLWQGLDRLDALLAAIHREVDLHRYRHAVTMTGELADIFRDRRRGVRQLLALFLRYADARRVRVYTTSGRLRSPDFAYLNTEQAASANWHATARLVGRSVPEALLIDIGSTTTDLVPIHRGAVCAHGYTDAERLQSGELLYTGVVRTPLYAVAARAPLDGMWQPLAAETFATSGDVHVLTNRLPARHYQSDTADGAGLGPGDCARRLARMFGRDASTGSLETWRRLARYFSAAQQYMIACAVERILSRRAASPNVALVGAGCGRFLVRDLARRNARPYVDIARVLRSPSAFRDIAAVCASAAAVAQLMATP